MIDSKIKIFAAGFVAEEEVIPWSSIMRVVGYKIDLLTVDEIRFDIGMHDGTVVTLSEEQIGFGALVRELERRFPSIVGWHSRVAHPPFATCGCVLYGPA